MARPVLQLLRPPNLFTVPGDPLCGALLASHGVWNCRILPPMAVSLCAYCAGLVINDLADYREDLRDRPSRPLPSGAVSRGFAVGLAIFFLAVALGAAFCVNRVVAVMAVVLIVEILWYNLLAKHNALIAPVAMGLCRGTSVLVGAVAIAPFGPQTAWRNPACIAALVILIYIAIVTALARRETEDPRMPARIGMLIRALLFIQAGFCLWAGNVGWGAAVVLLALWPISRMVGSHFYAS